MERVLNQKYTIMVAIFFLICGFIIGKYSPNIFNAKELEAGKVLTNTAITKETNGDSFVNLHTLSDKTDGKKYRYDCYNSVGHVNYWLITEEFLPAGTTRTKDGVDYKCKYVGYVD